MATFINGSEKVSNQDIESCPKWFSFDVEFGTDAELFKLMDIPEHTTILDGYVDVLVAGDGTTNTLDIELDPGAGAGADTSVLTGVNLQTTGTRQLGTVNPGTNPEEYPRTAADSPEALTAVVGESGTTNTAPVARISLLMYRNLRPGSDSHPRVTPG